MKRIAAALLVGVVAVGGLVDTASSSFAQPVRRAGCTYSVTGSPGTESYTAHITDTCDTLKTRAVITYENFYGTYLYGYGSWVVQGSSKASTSSNVTDTLVCWGHQYQYYASGGGIKVGTGWGRSGCP